MEYTFTFYDDTYGYRRAVTGLVVDVYEDQIKIKCVKDKDMVDCNKCHKRKSCGRASDHILAPMPTCNCVLVPPDTSKYDEPTIYFIPLQNIVNVSYIISENNQKPPKKIGGTKVMVLGISATIVRAIVINLDIIEDNLEESVREVTLEAGKVYDFVYEEHGSIYENRGKVVDIQEVPTDCTTGENSIVRENVGEGDSIYTRCHHRTHKKDFMNQPPIRKILIKIDVSEEYDGEYEIIELSSIRDCTLVEEEETEENNE